MKHRTHLAWPAIAAALLFCTLCLETAQGKSLIPFTGKTGAPGHGSCMECHTGTGTGNVNLTFGGGGQYELNTLYSLSITITDPTQIRWGFSMVARDTDDNLVDVGTWSIAPGSTDTTIQGAGGGDTDSEISHLNAPFTPGVHEYTFDVNWTAPATSVGDVTFYLAANAANGDGQRDAGMSGLDHVYLTSLTISELILTNQAPVFTVPGGTVNTPSGFTTPITGISLDDPDAGSGNVTVDLSVQNGLLSVSSSVSGGVGPGDITNNGSSSVTIVSTLAKLNATFGDAQGITYQSNSLYTGSDTLQLVANDNGNTGPGGAQIGNAAISITVNGVTYADWETQQGFALGEEGALSDPDKDGVPNLREFFGGTDPLLGSDVDRPFLRSVAGGIEFVYRRAKATAGVSEQIEDSGDLVGWGTYSPAPSEITITDLGATEEVAIAIPSPTGNRFIRLRVDGPP